MKKFFKDPYSRWGALIIVCGAILILFNNWVNKATITIGFEAINDALAPVYIGIVLAFLMCPLYNLLVGKLYYRLCAMDEGDSKVRPVFNSFQSYRRRELLELPLATKKRKNLGAARMIASAICLIVVIGIVALLVYFVAPQLIETSKVLVNTGPEKLDYLTKFVSDHLGKYPSLAKKVEDMTNLGYTEVMNWIKMQLTSEKAQDFATIISNGVFSVLDALMNAVIGVLIMVYLLNYKEKLFAIARKLSAAIFKEKTAQNIREFVEILDTTLVDFVVGRILDSAIIGVITFVAMSVLQIPFAPMISVIIGVTNVIPFFGPFIGAIPSIMILLIEQPIDALWFTIMIFLIQQLDGNVIGPKIVGNAIGIESFWVLVAVLVGGSLFGFLGMVFAVPVFALIYRYVNKLTRKRLYSMDKDYKTTDYMTLEELGIEISEIDMSMKGGKSVLFRRRKSATEKIEEKLEHVVDDSQLIDTTLKEDATEDAVIEADASIEIDEIDETAEILNSIVKDEEDADK